jgi:DNA (cytosine-5)-methyltransferase 1
VTPEAYAELLDAAWSAHLAPRAEDAPTVVSTFAGGGGSSLGYSMAGYRELVAVDFDDHAVATLRANLHGVKVVQADLMKLGTRELLDLAGLEPGQLDVFDGSPPCQGFSTVGESNPDDERNRLFEHFVRLLGELRPRAFVMENVSGMVKGKMRLVFREVLQALKGAGYRVAVSLLDASYYEVPQARERLIFVGVRADLGVEPSLPPPRIARPYTVRDVLSSVRAEGPDLDDGLTPALDEYGRKWWPLVREGELLAGAKRRIHGRRAKVDLGDSMAVQKLHPGRPSRTILKTQKGTGKDTLVHPTRPRAVSITEAKVLASFPPGYVLEGTYQERWARIGNCVPPLLMRAVAEHVRHLLSGGAS